MVRNGSGVYLWVWVDSAFRADRMKRFTMGKGWRGSQEVCVSVSEEVCEAEIFRERIINTQ